jgi:hypothetical protein
MLLLSACLEPGIECRSDADCTDGNRCDSKYRVCVSTCVDTLSDPNNCGSCGNVCPADPGGEAVCSNGSCALMCRAGYSDCGTQFCNDLSSTASCGGSCVACNIPQASGIYNISSAGCCQTADAADNSCDAFCSRGVGAENCSCRFVCAAGFADCDLDTAAGADTNGCEVQLSAGLPDGQGGYKHCGACNYNCEKLPNETTSCDGGVCQWDCNALTRDCDLVRSNGCETPLNTNSNCGACGTPCPPPGVANVSSPTCSTGTCSWSCSPGWGTCDGNDANGCETDLTTTARCGACNNACPTTFNGFPTCINSQCGIGCRAGYQNCDGTCYSSVGLCP